MKNLFCEDRDCTKSGNKWCVRRVMGTLGWCAFIIAVFCHIEHDSLQLLGLLSASLLGLTTIDKWVKN